MFISDVYPSLEEFLSNCSVFVIWFSIILLIFFFTVFETVQFV